MLTRMREFIENIFIDSEKTEEIHDIRNKVTAAKLEIEHRHKQIQRDLRNTTAYKVARATGRYGIR